MVINWNEIAEKDFLAGLGGKDKGIIEIIQSTPSLIGLQGGNKGLIKGMKGINMNTKMYCGASVKGVDQEERTLVGVASNDALDRDREKILKGAWKDGLESYRQNPVIMLSHIYSGVEGLPIGRALWIREDPSQGLVFKMRWATKGVNPVADVVAGLYQDQVMNAFSVGFLPIEFEDHVENSTKLYEPLRTYSKCQLLEISAVAIPSNSEAVVQSAIKAYRAKANIVKPSKRITPSQEYLWSKDDGMIEIDDSILLRGFSRVGEFTTRTIDQYLPEMGRIVSEEIGENVGRMLRKAMGRAY